MLHSVYISKFWICNNNYYYGEKMQTPLLSDEAIFPNDEILLKYLGNTKTIWDLFVSTIAQKSPLMSLEWHYYRDGKSWLCKLIKGKKTICWISICDKMFQLTFYFNIKYESEIKNFDIGQELKNQYLSNDNIGKIRPLRIKIVNKDDLKDALKLIRYKEKMK